MESNSLISIIVPCYNQAQYMDECLQSVFDQTYSNWECIIVNDGSKDDTVCVARKWVGKDPRFVCFYKENGGVSSARNLGIEKAKGEYLQFLDSDDVLDCRKIELSLKLIKESPENDLKMVISNFRMFTINPEHTTEPFCKLNAQLFNFESLLYQWNESFSVQIQCGFFEASIFETIQFQENLTAQEDWVVWVEIFKKGYKAFFVDMPLALYRINPTSRTMASGMYEDQIKAYRYFKTILSEDEFKELSLTLISRYYKLNTNLKYKIGAIKKSNTYQTGLMVKKVLKKMRILPFFKSWFPFILQMKSK